MYFGQYIFITKKLYIRWSQQKLYLPIVDPRGLFMPFTNVAQLVPYTIDVTIQKCPLSLREFE